MLKGIEKGTTISFEPPDGSKKLVMRGLMRDFREIPCTKCQSKNVEQTRRGEFTPMNKLETWISCTATIAGIDGK